MDQINLCLTLMSLNCIKWTTLKYLMLIFKIELNWEDWWKIQNALWFREISPLLSLKNWWGNKCNQRVTTYSRREMSWKNFLTWNSFRESINKYILHCLIKTLILMKLIHSEKAMQFQTWNYFSLIFRNNYIKKRHLNTNVRSNFVTSVWGMSTRIMFKRYWRTKIGIVITARAIVCVLDVNYKTIQRMRKHTLFLWVDH